MSAEYEFKGRSTGYAQSPSCPAHACPKDIWLTVLETECCTRWILPIEAVLTLLFLHAIVYMGGKLERTKKKSSCYFHNCKFWGKFVEIIVDVSVQPDLSPRLGKFIDVSMVISNDG